MITTSPESADAGLQRMTCTLREKGVVYTEDPPGHDELIGFTLDREGRRWLPHCRKLSRVANALQFLISSQISVTCQELERLGGHLVHLFGIRSELYCTMHAL